MSLHKLQLQLHTLIFQKNSSMCVYLCYPCNDMQQKALQMRENVTIYALNGRGSSTACWHHKVHGSQAIHFQPWESMSNRLTAAAEDPPGSLQEISGEHLEIKEATESFQEAPGSTRDF